MTDLLGDILNMVVLEGAQYDRAEFHPPFGIAVPGCRREARFHLVVQGRCHVRLDDGAGAVLSPGDLALLPSGSPHLLTSDETRPGEPLAEVLTQADYRDVRPLVAGEGPEDQACRMVCGRFAFAHGATHPLLHSAPELLYISAAERAGRPMLDDIVRLIERRMDTGGTGPAESISRLSEVLFIEVLRAGVALSLDDGRPTAIYDRQIGKALSLIHADVAADWTVERLASAVFMSRSRFARRFRELVGAAPMAYVAERRLQRALRLIDLHAMPVKVVAANVGFRSAAAFTRAFTERFGYPPTRHDRGRTVAKER